MNQDRNRLIVTLILVVIIGAGIFMYLTPEEKEEIQLTYGFDYGLEDWSKEADVPRDPNNPGNKVAWNITQAEDMTDPTDGVARFYIDGSQDDGTIWLEQEIALKPNTEYNGTISFELYSRSESFNQLAEVVGYIGPQDPEAEIDLAQLGAANQVEGWKTYSQSVVFSTDSDGSAWVACGISVRWETEMIYLIDDVMIEFK